MTVSFDVVEPILARLLLQESMGMGVVPGLSEALKGTDTMATALPAHHLTREEWERTFVVPWLADRIRRGGTLEEAERDYGLCAAFYPCFQIMALPNPLVVQGYIAARCPDLRDLLGNDDALFAVVAVEEQVGNVLFESQGHADFHLNPPPYDPEDEPVVSEAWLLADGLKKIAAYLGTLTTSSARPALIAAIDLEPVIAHLKDVVRHLRDVMCQE